METKTCFKCLVCKPVSDFYKHPTTKDGTLNKCKECAKQDVRRNRIENIEEHRAKDRQRGCRTKPEQLRRYREEYPDRFRANYTMYAALRAGDIKRWPCCAIPECSAGRVVGHHPDYERPLDVVWLCQLHHRQLHSEGGRGVTG